MCGCGMKLGSIGFLVGAEQLRPISTLEKGTSVRMRRLLGQRPLRGHEVLDVLQNLFTGVITSSVFYNNQMR